MCITIHPARLPREAPDAALSLGRDTLVVRDDVGSGGMRGPTKAINTELQPVSDLAMAEEVLPHG